MSKKLQDCRKNTTGLMKFTNLRSIIFKYPRLLSLLFSIMLAIVIFYEGTHCKLIHDALFSLGHWGTFLAGFFYVYGFTAPPAAAVLLILGQEQSLLYAGIIGSLGAWVGDVILFFFVKKVFMKEIQLLKKHTSFKWLEKITLKNTFSVGIYLLCGIFIASPLPTEIGIVLLSSQEEVSLRKFIISIMIFHPIGIFTMLWLGSRL